MLRFLKRILRRRYRTTVTPARLAYRKRRQARIDATCDGTITTSAVTRLKALWPGYCPACGRRAKPTLDHIIPLSQGGAHSIHNIQLICGICNSRKGGRRGSRTPRRRKY